MTMGSLPVEISIYEIQDGSTSVVKLTWRLLYVLIPSTLVMLSVFFYNIDKKFINTYISMERCNDFTIRYFRESQDDAKKAMFTFGRSKHHWKSIDDEVRVWIEEIGADGRITSQSG